MRNPFLTKHLHTHCVDVEHLRIRAGEVGYGGGFIERYVTAALYPQGLTREIQIGLGIAVVAVNVIIYVIAIKRAQKGHPSTGFSLFRRTHR